MFEQSLMSNAVGKSSRWTMALSFGLQMLLVGVAVLIPLLNYYELPAGQLMGFLVAPPPPPPPAPPPVVTRRIIPEQYNPMATPVAIPDRVAIIQDEPPPATSIAGVVGGVGGSFGGALGGIIGSIVSSTPIVAPPPPPVKRAPPPPKRIRVGGAVSRANLIRQVRPVYPPLARQARIQGTVKLTAIISKTGSIEKLEVLQGHPLLIPAALFAVKQWRYRPTLLNGQPVEVVTQVDVNFTLRG
jgi:protein TonB